jgi:LacI family transcriptional regulator
LEQQRVEGVLLTPVAPDDPRMSEFPRRGTPVVLVDSCGGPRHCSVTVDDVLGGDLAVTHLLESGHRRIAFVGGPRSTGQVADRITGAEQAVARAPGAGLTVLETTALNVADGRRAGERIAELPIARRPTAAFCSNDLLALGLLQQMVCLGLRVPGDLAIVGYDDIEFAEAALCPSPRSTGLASFSAAGPPSCCSPSPQPGRSRAPTSGVTSSARGADIYPPAAGEQAGMKIATRTSSQELG